MRNFFTFLGAIAVSVTANAQSAITLNSSNVTGLQTGKAHWNVASNVGMKSPSTGSNQTWDLSGMKDSIQMTTNYVSATGFTSTSVVDTSTYENVIPGAIVKSGFVYDVDANGYFVAGGIIPAQAYSEGFLTGNKYDSSHWAPQTYKDRQNLMVFPATAGSSWTSNGYHRLTFTITVAAYSLKDVPVTVAKHYYVKDTVVGWGTVNVPSSNKSSIGYNSLLVRRKTIVVDSFYLAGNVAPPAMLVALGVKQNDSSATYNEYLYRAGTGTPLVSYSYPDNTYSKPSYTTYDADNVESGINNQGYDPAIFNIFPNPATAGPVNIQVNKLSQNPWNLTVVNSLGQTMVSEKIEGSGNRNLQLNMAGCKAGLYFVHVADNNGNVLMSSKLELTR